MDLKRTQLLLLSLIFAFLCCADQVRKLNGDSIPGGCKPMERDALLGFKGGLKDPSNRLSSWMGDDCCTWKGVACDNRTNHVVKLDLCNPHPLMSDANKWSLGGELRPSLLDLKHLNYLDLSMNNFGGIRIPKFMGSFSQLKYLNLSYNGFGGPIPHQLGNLSSLQYLDLSANSFTGPIPHQLGNLSSLQYLDLSYNYYYYGDNFEVLIIDNAIWISRLSSLRYLNMSVVEFREGAHWLQALNMLPSIVDVRLSYCGINSTIPLSLPHVNFTSLSVLDLSLSQINSTIPGWLFNISSLEYLDLSSNYFWGIIPPAIKNLASLKFLDLSYNFFLEGKIPAALGGLCKLQHLDLSTMNSGKNLHEFDEVFTGCIKNSLETLDMRSTQLSGYLPDSLGDFKMLKSLDLSSNTISGPLPESLGRLSVLQELHLFNNKLNGTIPESLGKLTELVYLDLSNNKLNGTIPESLGRLTELVYLHLFNNMLSGTIPKSLGRLTELVYFDLGSNILEGVISEEQFANLTKLNYLDLSKNQLVVNLALDWIAPFQLQQLYISSCKLGSRFPAWLRMQQNIISLDMSSIGISDTVPDWFWRSFSQIRRLDISDNGITGSVPDLTNFINLEYLNLSSNYLEGLLPNFNSTGCLQVDLSNNSFSGVIHPDIGKSMSCFSSLSLSKNNLSGEIPLSLCQLNLFLLDLSKNLLFGELPNCWNHSHIIFMDFSSNNLSGSIPLSVCSLPILVSLHLSYNNLSGELPSSLKSCRNLATLDLGHNGFTGTIPTWIGESLLSLKFLSLRSNKLIGNIPSNLSRLSALQILDLANNNLSGNIPSRFGSFTAMKVLHKTYGTILDSFNTTKEDEMQLTIKGIYIEYARLLPLVIAMDLSNNNLSGMIPEELTSLSGLMSLNLSKNHLTGEITEKIGALQQLESLDLSRNNLFGGIPSSMIALTFLSHLNLSYNNLSGKIPTSNQFSTFSDPSIYANNPGLCGSPLHQQCKGDETNHGPNAIGGDEQNDNAMDEERFEMKYMYMSMGLGFAVGFWAIVGPLVLIRKWSETYFRLIDQVYDMVYVALVVIFTRFKGHNIVA